MTLAGELARFSMSYDSAHLLVYRKAIGLPPDNSIILADPLKTFMLFTMYAHERGGANPNYGRYQRLAVREALNGKRFEDAIQDSDFADGVWQNFVRLTRGKPNAQITEGVVRDILTELRKLSEPNWIRLLEKKQPLEAFEWLDDLRGMAEKLAAFSVRDLATMWNLWQVKREQMFVLQPLDIWVVDWSERIWKNIFDDVWGTLNQMKAVTERCLSEGVNPAEFNKGAWFLGSYFNDVCEFFGVGEVDRKDRLNCIRRFDPTALQKAIIEYSKQSSQRSVFAP
jgi:hypothetical protein